MREHLLNILLTCVALAGPLLGCQEKPEPVEPIPNAAPIALNQFVRGWAKIPDLEAGDAIKELHPRETIVYAYTKSGQVIALLRETGDPQWIAKIRSTDRAGMRPPVVLKESVVIPTSGTLEMFDPTEGTFLKSVPLRVAARSNAVGQGTLVYIGGDDAKGAGRVVTLDVSKPYVPTVWQLMIPHAGLKSTPALFQEVLYIGGGDGNVYAVSASNREALWPLKGGAFKTGGAVTGDVAADETGVYVASMDSRMYCLNRGSGRLKWQYYAGKPLPEGPVLAADVVLLTVPGTGTAAFSKEEVDPSNPQTAYNRQPLWVATGMAQFLAADEKFVYLRRGSDNVIVALDKKTGEQKFQSNRRDLVVFGTNSKPDGVIFAASKTNRIIAIKPVLRPGVVGELVWNETDVTDAVAMAR